MSSARYYRDQAMLLLKWASESGNPGVARRLAGRAKDMLTLAEDVDERNGSLDSALDLFNQQQMTPRPNGEPPQAD